MQAADVADHPGVRRQAEELAGRLAGDLLGLHRGHVDAVVKGFDALGRPARQAGAHVVAHRIGHAEQGQALAEEIGEQLPRAAAIVAEGVMHPDHRQLRAQQCHIDRLEAVGDAQAKVPRGGDPADLRDGLELEPAHRAAGVIEEDHLVRGRATHHLIARRAGQVDGADLVGRADEERGVLPRAIEERAVIAVAELQHPGLPAIRRLRRCHTRPPRP